MLLTVSLVPLSSEQTWDNNFPLTASELSWRLAPVELQIAAAATPEEKEMSNKTFESVD